MNSFNVNLTIIDCTYSCKCKNCYSREINITSSLKTIDLQNGYILNVLSVTDTYATVLIQNGFQVIIRNIRDYPMRICIPSKNYPHIVTLSAIINEST